MSAEAKMIEYAARQVTGKLNDKAVSLNAVIDILNNCFASKYAIWSVKQLPSIAQPCGDVISRQAVKEQMIKYGFHAPDMTVTEFVEDLPSVIPQEKECEDKIEELFERVENIEKQMKEDNEEQLNKLKAELEYAKFCCALPTIMDMM